MGNRIFLSVVVATAMALFYSTFFFKKSLIAAQSSPEGMPRAILIAIIIVGLMLLIRDWKKGLSAHVQELFQGTRLYVTIAIPFFVLLLPVIGFMASTFLLLFSLFILLEEKKPQAKQVGIHAILALVLSASVFYVFKEFFHIQLPVFFG